MPTATTRTFKSGNSEAVRLPKDLGFGVGVDLTLVRSGDVLTLSPTRKTARDLAKVLAEIPAPSSIGTRDEVYIPERG
jgi:antitoxin VapB